MNRENNHTHSQTSAHNHSQSQTSIQNHSQSQISIQNQWTDDFDNETVEIIDKKPISDDSSIDSKTEDVPVYCETQEGEGAEDATYIEDLIQRNPEILSSNEIIQYECGIAYFSQILIVGSKVDDKNGRKLHSCREITFSKMKDFLDYLKWISKGSEVLAKRINQEMVPYTSDKVPTIIRSSYNFCRKYTQCQDFYNKNQMPTCTDHHYVHNLLKYDVDSIIAFLEYKISKAYHLTQDDYNNLLLSIKTICFVTRHMAKEISYIDGITRNNSETFHRNNPVDIGKRKLGLKSGLGFGSRREEMDESPVRIEEVNRKDWLCEEEYPFYRDAMQWDVDMTKVEYINCARNTIPQERQCRRKRKPNSNFNPSLSRSNSGKSTLKTAHKTASESTIPKNSCNNRYSILSAI